MKFKIRFSTFWVTALLTAFVIPLYEASSTTAIGEVLPLGDSITYGGGGTGGGYRARLHLLLDSGGDLFRFIGSATNNSTPTLIAAGQHHHEGHPGYRIDQIHGNLTGLVFSDGSSNGGHWFVGGHDTGREAIFPDLILVHIGTNDATQGRTAAQMQVLLDNLLTEISDNRPNAQVIVASLILRTDSSGLEAVQMAYNDGIPGIVAAKGANFHFLDMHAVLDAADLVDGVHPRQTGYDKMADAWAPAIQSITTLEPLNMATAVSRRTHGTAGNFDINLPLTGEPGVECRMAGDGDIDTLVFTFTNNVTSGNASVTSGTGTISGSPTFANNVMVVNLTGVFDAQQITVTLSGVTDAYSQVLPDTPVTMNVLLGDTTANKMTNASDVAQTKGQSGAVVTEANFRTDVNVSGTVTASDIALVKANAGHGLP